MATYDYQCSECNFKEEQIHSMKENPLFFCPICKEDGKEIQMKKVFTINTSGFIIKGGTEAINWKEKRHHIKKNKELSIRQIERYGTSGVKLKPNVGGLEQESWSDAAKLAKEAGMNADSYKPMIEKEQRTSKISGIDDAKWKKAKEDNF
jgi:putative FmdB family regulatory protein